MMARWLMAWSAQLAYPVQVHKRESPDFLLDTLAGKVGVECMEVVPAAYKQLLAKLSHINSGWVRPVARYHPGDARSERDSPLLRQLLADTHEGSEWVDDEPERLWLEVMRWAVEKKREVMHKPAFARQPRNVLLLYDNWPLPPVTFAEDVDEEAQRDLARMAMDTLSAQLISSGAHADFQQVDILREGWLLSFTDEGVRSVRYLTTRPN